MLHWLIWFVIRCVITLIAAFTTQTLIHTEGYFVETNVLIGVAVVLIVLIKVWSFDYKKEG
jgi:hypothetical protein